MKSKVSGGHHRGLKLSVGSEPFWREGKAYRNVCIGSRGPKFKTFCALLPQDHTLVLYIITSNVLSQISLHVSSCTSFI